jgi:hypothetical protein
MGRKEEYESIVNERKCMRVLYVILIIGFIACVGLTETRAQHGGFGLGIMAGEPTGISFKYWLSNSSAIDAGTAWSFRDYPSFHMHADYLWHKFDLIPVGKGELPLYFGLGSRLKIQSNEGDSEFGIRLPVGWAYIFADGRLDTFMEIVPVMDLFPATELNLNAAIGIRYFFR